MRDQQTINANTPKTAMFRTKSSRKRNKKLCVLKYEKKKKKLLKEHEHCCQKPPKNINRKLFIFIFFLLSCRILFSLSLFRLFFLPVFVFVIITTAIILITENGHGFVTRPAFFVCFILSFITRHFSIRARTSETIQKQVCFKFSSSFDDSEQKNEASRDDDVCRLELFGSLKHRRGVLSATKEGVYFSFPEYKKQKKKKNLFMSSKQLKRNVEEL